MTLNEAPRSASTSDVLLGVEGRLSDAWTLGALMQYNFDRSQTERLDFGFRLGRCYRTRSGKHAAFERARDMLEGLAVPCQLFDAPLRSEVGHGGPQ